MSPGRRAGTNCVCNREKFPGIVRHSSQHPGGEDYTGKKAVIIGSNNSAHDIAADLYEHGADVTMVQRTSTHVAGSSCVASGPGRIPLEKKRMKQ